MSFIVHRIEGDNAPVINYAEIRLTEDCAIGIDCSSTCTGLCIITTQGVPLYTFAVKRDKSDDYILYKVKLKNLLIELFSLYPMIKQVYYEEPFLGYAESSKILLALRTTIQEIKYENTPRFDYLNFKEVSNQTWKKLFLAPNKIPSGKDAQKAAVRKKLEESYFSCYKGLTQDEVDATAMALVCTMQMLIGDEDSITTTHKIKPFKYIIKFIGANSDEEMLDEFVEQVKVWKVPKKLKEKAYKLVTLNGRGLFDDKVYSSMGNDDTLLILKYDSSKYGNVTLEHRIGTLAASYPYLYAVVWRVRRKA